MVAPNVVKAAADGAMIYLMEDGRFADGFLTGPLDEDNVNVAPGASGAFFHEVNGDGIVDMMWLREPAMKTYLGRGDGTFELYADIEYPFEEILINPKDYRYWSRLVNFCCKKRRFFVHDEQNEGSDLEICAKTSKPPIQAAFEVFKKSARNWWLYLCVPGRTCICLSWKQLWGGRRIFLHLFCFSMSALAQQATLLISKT